MLVALYNSLFYQIAFFMTILFTSIFSFQGTDFQLFLYLLYQVFPHLFIRYIENRHSIFRHISHN